MEPSWVPGLQRLSRGGVTLHGGIHKRDFRTCGKSNGWGHVLTGRLGETGCCYVMFCF